MLSDPPDCSYDLLHLNVLYMYIYVFSFKSFFSCLYRVCSFVMILYHTFLYVLLTICFYVKSLYVFLFYALCLDAVKLNKPLNMNFVLWISDMYAPRKGVGSNPSPPPPFKCVNKFLSYNFFGSKCIFFNSINLKLRI